MNVYLFRQKINFQTRTNKMAEATAKMVNSTDETCLIDTESFDEGVGEIVDGGVGGVGDRVDEGVGEVVGAGVGEGEVVGA